MSNFYGTEIEIWSSFGPDGISEKKWGADYEQLLRVFFSCFHKKKKEFLFIKNIVAFTLKSCLELEI